MRRKWKLTRNKYIRSIKHTLERIGIKTSKSFVYKINLEKNKFTCVSIPSLPNVSIKLCTTDDLHNLPKETDKKEFHRDLEQGHIMIGAFLQDNLIAYAWHSNQKVFVPELETWVDFDGIYGWRWYVQRDYQTQGLGRELIKHFLNITAESFKEKTVFTLVETDNIPAQRALESLGFEKQSIISYMRLFKIKKYKEDKFIEVGPYIHY